MRDRERYTREEIPDESITELILLAQKVVHMDLTKSLPRIAGGTGVICRMREILFKPSPIQEAREDSSFHVIKQLSESLKVICDRIASIEQKMKGK
jgi:hypothetical protein